MIGLLTTSGNDDGSIRGGKPVRLLGTPPKKFEKRGPWWPLILAYFTIIEVQIYQPPETSNKDTILCTAAAFKSTLHMMMITYSLIMWHIYNLTVWVSVVLVFKYKCYSFLRILLMWMMEIKGKRFEFRAFCFFNFFTGVRLLITYRWWTMVGGASGEFLCLGSQQTQGSPPDNRSILRARKNFRAPFCTVWISLCRSTYLQLTGKIRHYVLGDFGENRTNLV